MLITFQAYGVIGLDTSLRRMKIPLPSLQRGQEGMRWGGAAPPDVYVVAE